MSTVVVCPVRLPPAIENLDLSRVYEVLVRDEEKEGYGWTPEQANQATKWYKRFLALIQHHMELPLVPTQFIDEVWHTHILDTRAYLPDCIGMFGGYLHHNPYFGIDDETELHRVGGETCDLFVEMFGESPRDVPCFQGTFMSKCSGCTHDGPSGRAPRIQKIALLD